MLYQQLYVWAVFLSAMDVMLTWLILSRSGDEVNPLARLVIGEWGMAGASAFKFALVMFAIVACELVGRRRHATGRRLAMACVLINALPVTWSLVLLATHWGHLQQQGVQVQ